MCVEGVFDNLAWNLMAFVVNVYIFLSPQSDFQDQVYVTYWSENLKNLKFILQY